MPEKDGDEGKSTKSVVNKKQKQMMGEEGYDIARDMGKVRPSKDKKDATTMPVSDEVKKTQKVVKGPSAFERVKAKYGKSVMNVGKKKVKEELDLTQVAEAFGGYIVEQNPPTYKDLMNQQDDSDETIRTSQKEIDKQKKMVDDARKKKLRTDRTREAQLANTTTKELDKRFKGAKFDTAPFARRERQYDTPMKDASGEPVISKKTGKPKREPKFLDQRSKYNVDPKTGVVPKSAVLDRLRNRLQSKVQADLQGTDAAKAMKAKQFKLSTDAVQDKNKEIQQQTKKRVDALMKDIEKQPLDTSTGKGGALDKRLRAYQDATNPTIPSATGKGRIPMPGGFDADGGRTGTKKQQKAYDAAVEAGKSAFYKDVAKGGVKGTPLDPTETNLQFKYDKAQSDLGGRVSPKASAKEMEQTKKYLRKRGFKVPGETTPDVEKMKPKKDRVTTGSGKDAKGQKDDTVTYGQPDKVKPKQGRLSKLATAAAANPAAALVTYDLGKGIIGKISKLRAPAVVGGKAGFRSAGGYQAT